MFREFVEIIRDKGFKTVKELVAFVIKREYDRESARLEIRRKEDAKLIAQRKGV